MNTAMLGIFVVLAAGVSEWTPELIGFATIACSLLVISLFFLALAMFPRIDGPKHSVTFFESIRSRTAESYYATIKELTEIDYLADLIEQSHRNAEIAHVKFWCVSLAMRAWFISIIAWAPMLYYLISEQRPG